MSQNNVVEFGKPCMSALPPRLGRRIIREIMTAPPVDYTESIKECERINRKLAAIKPLPEKP
ncbi:MAG: hypothetical protein K6G44_14060 [Lentisphaeria bacterium]|nr:hypothetical protein [Lentisphaeria bacterium]